MTKEEIKQYFIDLYVKHIKQEDIPEWVNWIAMDADGTVWLYQEKPVLDGHSYFNDSIDGDACPLVVPSANKTFLNNWAYSLLKLEDLLPHNSSQKEEEPAQDKIEFEAVSGDQSLFDLVGADDKDKVIVKSLHSKAVFAMAEPLAEYTVLAERRVKEKPYIPEVGHTYKISYSGCVYSEVYVCLFVDQFSVLWSSHAGRMWQHYLTDYKFIRVN